MKLVILLLQVRGHTIMQIIEQEGIEEGVIFVSSEGFELFSISYPVLSDSSVGLRGYNKEHDNYLVHVDSLVLDKVLTALTEFFYRLCGDFDTFTQDGYIYTFSGVIDKKIDKKTNKKG